MPKIMCPYHDDTQPSMELYPDGYGFCFSKCWKQYPMDPELIKKSHGKKAKKPKEDLPARLQYIESLPLKQVRGLQLPANDRGYFLVWPDKSYYKLRQWDMEPKYIGPSGHQPPLFKMSSSHFDKPLLIIEGELNALSAARALDWDIVSPGAAGHFKVHQSELIEISKNYRKLILWTDNDFAGHEALLSLAPELKTESNVVGFIHSDQDANEVLLTQGPQALAEKVGCTYVEIGEKAG